MMDQTKRQTADNGIQRNFSTKETTYLVTIRPYDLDVDVWVTEKVDDNQRAYVIQAESEKYGIQRNIFVEDTEDFTYIINNFAKVLADETPAFLKLKDI